MKKTLVLLLVPTSVFGYCPAHPDISTEFQESEFVFLGEVASEEPVEENGDFYDGINYTLTITEQFKGAHKNSFIVFSENSSGRFPMEKGVGYLIFTSRQSVLLADGPAFAVSNCGNSGPAGEQETAITQVRELAEHVAQPMVQRDGHASGAPAR
jgi:hypothetical protein